MHIVMFIMGAALLVTWFANLVSSHLGAGQMALNAFTGAAICLGLGAVIVHLRKVAPKP